MGLAGAGLGAAKINLVPLLISREISTATAANALAVAGLGQVLGRFCYPALARRTSPRGRIMAILVAGAVGVAALAAVRGPTALLLTLAIYVGCVRGVYTLLMATAVSDRWGTEHFGTLNGIAIAPATVAIALGPAIGALFAQVGGYPAAFYLLAGIVVVSAVLAAGTRTAARE
jgi:predicted MFS family arabinose efflux permease